MIWFSLVWVWMKWLCGSVMVKWICVGLMCSSRMLFVWVVLCVLVKLVVVVKVFRLGSVCCDR